MRFATVADGSNPRNGVQFTPPPSLNIWPRHKRIDEFFDVAGESPFSCGLCIERSLWLRLNLMQAQSRRKPIIDARWGITETATNKRGRQFAEMALHGWLKNTGRERLRSKAASHCFYQFAAKLGLSIEALPDFPRCSTSPREIPRSIASSQPISCSGQTHIKCSGPVPFVSARRGSRSKPGDIHHD